MTPSSPAPAPRFAGVLGQQGAGQLADPFGVAVAPDHSVWVADRGASVVKQFSPSGRYLGSVGTTALTGAAAGATILPASLSKAMASTLRSAGTGGGSIYDIEHIMILMQENRSFDHYFGTMPGVRGFRDPTAITLPTGNPVFYQPDPSHAQGYLLPFHYDTFATSAQATPGTDRSWPTQHQAWDNGKMDQWVAAKGEYTMGYYRQRDIPFHWALAGASTICDNYHCSVLGPTNPNRLYMWTGMIDPDGTGGGPIIDNTPAFNNIILSWTTYPERLEAAGISWKVYQEEDNYDDNALAWFKQYGYAPTSSPLASARPRRSCRRGQRAASSARRCSTTHSLIRFIEARFGVPEPNISAWRRQTCGDLTSAFRFGSRSPATQRTGSSGWPSPRAGCCGRRRRLMTTRSRCRRR